MQKNNKADESLEPRLFGIAQSNRAHADMWGKDCFNSAFPAALACYMRANGVPLVYVRAGVENDSLVVQNAEVAVGHVFGVADNVSNEDLFFSFETKFQPYLEHVHDPSELEGVDLVVKHDDDWLRALQIKLTVVPDDSTSRDDQEEWAPEIVLRPADSCSCALGIHRSVADRAAEVAEIFGNVCADIQHWDNRAEISGKKESLLECVENFLSSFWELQQPYLLQTIWMTKGKNPVLADNAFDIFAWSDFALISAYLKQAQEETGSAINRASRAVVRFARTQYELANSAQRKIHIRPIYRQMDFRKQTDKEIAISGKMSRRYMTSPRRTNPALPPRILKDIILNGGHNMLSPERRFDQTVYFTAARYFGEDSAGG